MKKLKGFTLIELLVVIAIIGMLSTLAVVSLNTARAKARDAKRLSAVKSMSTVIEIAAANLSNGSYATVLTSCSAADVFTSTCGTIEGTNFANFVDPSTNSVVCAEGANTRCMYTIGAAVAATTYEICFNTETTTAIGVAGTWRITQGGVFDATCST